jgi:hypothetical protein
MTPFMIVPRATTRSQSRCFISNPKERDQGDQSKITEPKLQMNRDDAILSASESPTFIFWLMQG